MKEAVGVGAIDELFAHLEKLLKTPQVGLELGQRGVNASIALLAMQGLRAYANGQKTRAAEDWETAAEEVRARLSMNAPSGQS
jgi:hypothetical protein